MSKNREREQITEKEKEEGHQHITWKDSGSLDRFLRWKRGMQFQLSSTEQAHNTRHYNTAEIWSAWRNCILQARWMVQTIDGLEEGIISLLRPHLIPDNCLSSCNKWANIHFLTDASIHRMCLCMLLISPSRGKLHQMHLLGNGAQRELLTSRLRRRRLNYRAYPELMILYYCLRNNAVFLILWASAGKGDRRAEWKRRQCRGWVWCWLVGWLEDNNSLSLGPVKWSEPMKCGETKNVLQLRGQGEPDTKNQYVAETNTYHENISNSKTACVRTERQQVGTK